MALHGGRELDPDASSFEHFYAESAVAGGVGWGKGGHRAQAMDPAQTLMPTEWRNLPAYALVPGGAMALIEQRRGDAEAALEKLTLDRTLWLDASGQDVSVHDTLVGDFTHSWRLDVGDGTRLGRASVDGQEQFITHYQPTQHDGVEIRAGQTVIETDAPVVVTTGCLGSSSKQS